MTSHPETENGDYSIRFDSSCPESRHERLQSKVYARLDSENAKEVFV